jgi:hypothetical protein
MWMYLGPSCLNRPFSIELGDTDGVELNLGSDPIPLREGVDSP